jgi:hypothetical protein
MARSVPKTPVVERGMALHKMIRVRFLKKEPDG